MKKKTGFWKLLLFGLALAGGFFAGRYTERRGITIEIAKNKKR